MSIGPFPQHLHLVGALAQRQLLIAVGPLVREAAGLLGTRGLAEAGLAHIEAGTIREEIAAQIASRRFAAAFEAIKDQLGHEFARVYEPLLTGTKVVASPATDPPAKIEPAAPPVAVEPAPAKIEPPAEPAAPVKASRPTTRTPAGAPSRKTPTETKQDDPITAIKKLASKCRKEHDGVNGPTITITYAVGTTGVVLSATPTTPGELGKCLAGAVKATTFPPERRLGQTIDL